MKAWLNAVVFILALGGVLVLSQGPVLADEPEPSGGNSANSECQLGPIEKGFGRSDWLVYGCADGASLYILARPDNPASPSYFTFTRHEGGYTLAGEGVGKLKVTRRAFEDLKVLGPDDIAYLYRQVEAGAAVAAE